MPNINLGIESGAGSGRAFVKPDVELLTKTARTASIDSSWLDLEDRSASDFVLDSAAGTGTTPTLDVKIQHSIDQVVIFDAASGAFTQVTTVASTQRLALKDLMRYVRARAVIAGTTPSFNFGVKADVKPQGV